MAQRYVDVRRGGGRASARSLEFSLTSGKPADARAAAPAAAAAASPAPGLPSPAAGSTLVERALSFVRAEQNKASSFAGQADVSSFVPDPVIQRTSSGAAAVHFQQQYRGLPVFQMVRTVRFAPQGNALDAEGKSMAIPPDISIDPKITAVEAVQKAAEHLAATGP